MRPNKAETTLHGSCCPGDMTVRMRKVLARQWVGVRVCPLLLLIFYINLLTQRSAIKADRPFHSQRMPWEKLHPVFFHGRLRNQRSER